MVAWIDEILARHPGAEAGAAPLQVQLFNSNNAHSEFFHHLSALGARTTRCARSTGTRSRTASRASTTSRKATRASWASSRTCTAASCACGRSRSAASRRTASRPSPTAWPTRAAPTTRSRRDRALLRASAALALLLPLLYLLWLMVLRPGGTQTGLAQRIEQHLQGYACADLSASVGKDGHTQVSGFVSLPEDLPRVAREVSAMPGVQLAALRRGPARVAALRGVRHPQALPGAQQEKAYGLDVDAPTAHDRQLREGDNVRVQVVAPRHDSYIWVDYYTADGSVMHLNAGQAPTPLHAGATLELGRDIPSSWLVSPPFGSVLITVLSAPMPFTETSDRPPFELASAYLLRLREALAASKNSERLIADFVFLETVPLAMTALLSPTHFFWLLLALCLLGFGCCTRWCTTRAAARGGVPCCGASRRSMRPRTRRPSRRCANRWRRRARRCGSAPRPARSSHDPLPGAVVPVHRRCGGRPAGLLATAQGERPAPPDSDRRQRSVRCGPAGAGG
jgi:hypothetical protein